MTPIESIQEVDGKEIDPKEQKPKEGVSVNRMSDIPDSRGDFPVSTTTFNRGCSLMTSSLEGE